MPKAGSTDPDAAVDECARLVALIGQLSEISTLETFDLFADLDDVASRVHEADQRGVRLQLAGMCSGAWVTADRPSPVERASGRVWSPTPADAQNRGLGNALVVAIPLPDQDTGSTTTDPV